MKVNAIKLRKSLKLMGALCLTAALGCTAVIASAAEVKTPAEAAKNTETLTLLNGKQVFKLQGYEVQPVPGGAPGKMYVNKQAKRALLVGEEDIPLIARGTSATDFLNSMKSIKDKQKSASPAYTVISETTENVNGLQVYHIEATNNMSGSNVLQATLLATDNKKFTIIQIFSNAKDKLGHINAVNNILGK